jgi:hypothetical protein
MMMRKKRKFQMKPKLHPEIASMAEKIGVSPEEAYKVLLALKKGKIDRSKLEFFLPREELLREGTTPEMAALAMYKGLERKSKRERVLRTRPGLKRKLDFYDLIALMMFEEHVKGVPRKEIAAKFGVAEATAIGAIRSVRGALTPEEYGFAVKKMHKELPKETKKIRREKLSEWHKRYWEEIPQKEYDKRIEKFREVGENWYNAIPEHIREEFEASMSDLAKEYNVRKLPKNSPEMMEYKRESSKVWQHLWDSLEGEQRKKKK